MPKSGYDYRPDRTASHALETDNDFDKWYQEEKKINKESLTLSM